MTAPIGNAHNGNVHEGTGQSRMGRRLLLLAGGASAAAAAGPALAKPREQAPPRHGQKAADPAPTGSPAQTPVGPLDLLSRWAVVIDFTTGTVLLDKDADKPMPPSSMTKLMTAYLVYERLKKGQLKLTDQLPVSERAWRMGGSKMFVQVGTSVPVEDLIRGMIVQSGNDACIVLAEGIAGSEEGFVELMNKKAARAWPEEFEFSQLHRLARPGPPHERARHRHSGAPHHPGLSGVLPLRFGKIFQI